MGGSCGKGTEEPVRNYSAGTESGNFSKTSSSITTKSPYKLKIVLLGDTGVGKTSLLLQVGYKKFSSKPTPDFNEVTKQLTIDDKTVLLQIPDTEGQEDVGGRGLEAAFFAGAKGCMLVYDVTNPRSLDSLKNWHNQFTTRVISSQPAGKTFPFVVLGNKCDQDAGKNCAELLETVEQWCRNNGNISHILTSAKENKKVDEAFHHIAKLCLNKEMRSTNQNSTWKDVTKSPLHEGMSTNQNSTWKDVTRPPLHEGNGKLDREQTKPFHREQPKPPYLNNINVKGPQGLVPEQLVPQTNEILARYHETLVPKKIEALPQKVEALPHRAFSFN